MAHRIEVGLAPGVQDAPGDKIRRRIEAELGIALAGARVLDVYTIDADLTADQLARVAARWPTQGTSSTGRSRWPCGPG